MKRTLCALAIAALTGCSAHQGSSAGAASGQAEPGSKRGGFPASELSPEQVRLVQRALAERGYAVDLTGTFDSRTQAALAEFQRARGLPADGRLDSNTLETLGVDPRDVMPVRGADEETQPSREGTPSSREGAPSY